MWPIVGVGLVIFTFINMHTGNNKILRFVAINSNLKSWSIVFGSDMLYIGEFFFDLGEPVDIFFLQFIFDR